MPCDPMRKRSSVKGGTGMLFGYASVSKGDEQSNKVQTKTLRARPAAAASSKRSLPARAGTGWNCTECWTSYVRVMSSSSESSIAYRAR